MNSQNIIGRINPAIFALLLVAIVGVTLGLSSDAHAQNVNVKFDRLDVTQERNQVVVNYAINSKDWRKIQHHRISPSLDLYVDQGRRGRSTYLTGQTLRHRTGTLVFRGTQLSRHQNDVDVMLSGNRGRAKINRVSLGRQKGGSVQVAVMRPAPPRHAPTRRAAQAPAPKKSLFGNINVRVGF
ncbi:MAG: hypothetical protein ACNA8W_05805 [Bradymonadaceae bacterium]